ncbi:hypothetical protein [Deinococcus kurensis]|uniref:hypothetical protein n=1 Tax=Deinococcus kurensis TaxID=2662757 RepID=UPI0012D2FCB1|nr:hypothetical protein [Deinococcus kurensis]
MTKRPPAPRTTLSHARMARVVALLLQAGGTTMPDILGTLASEGLDATAQTVHDILGALEDAGLPVTGRRAAHRSGRTRLRLSIPASAATVRIIQVVFPADTDHLAAHQRLCAQSAATLLSTLPGGAVYRLGASAEEHRAFDLLTAQMGLQVTRIG